jgi:hypothetical protein
LIAVAGAPGRFAETLPVADVVVTPAEAPPGSAGGGQAVEIVVSVAFVL